MSIFSKILLERIRRDHTTSGENIESNVPRPGKRSVDRRLEMCQIMRSKGDQRPRRYRGPLLLARANNAAAVAKIKTRGAIRQCQQTHHRLWISGLHQYAIGPSSDVFAALTIASTSSVVISPRTMRNGHASARPVIKKRALSTRSC
jgi:hypothetical protein